VNERARNPDDATRASWARIWVALIAVGGVLAIGSAFMPWMAVNAGEKQAFTGLDAGGDGVITAALGALCVALALRGWVSPNGPTRMSGTVSLVAGFFILSIPALDWADFQRAMSLDPAFAGLISPEFGLYATALGGLLTIVGGWQLRRLLRPPRAPAAETSKL
jgi:hypothetical protein